MQTKVILFWDSLSVLCCQIVRIIIMIINNPLTQDSGHNRETRERLRWGRNIVEDILFL